MHKSAIKFAIIQVKRNPVFRRPYDPPWWRHQMETFSALLAICAGNSPVPGEFPTQRPVTRSFDVFFDLRLNKRLSKQSWGWSFETLSRPLWRHCNEVLCCPVQNSPRLIFPRAYVPTQIISHILCSPGSYVPPYNYHKSCYTCLAFVRLGWR